MQKLKRRIKYLFLISLFILLSLAKLPSKASRKVHYTNVDNKLDLRVHYLVSLYEKCFISYAHLSSEFLDYENML